MDVLEKLHRTASVELLVRTYIIENMLLGHDSGFENDTSLLDAGILDSTGAMELVAFLEKNFNISVRDEEISPENLDSVERICAFVTEKRLLAA